MQTIVSTLRIMNGKMNIKTIIWFILVSVFNKINSQVSNSNNAFDQTEFTIKPFKILLGLTLNLDILCSFNTENHNFRTSLLSISISHSTRINNPAFNYLASVNVIDGLAHNITGDVSEISGVINNANVSFLNIKISDPDVTSEGLYKCELNGFDNAGKPILLTNLTSIKAIQPDLDTLYNEVNAINAQIKPRQDFFKRFQLMKDSLFYASMPYNGHQYYMIKQNDYFIYSVAQAECELFGGYLVELDSHEEFVFVRDFILKLNIFGKFVWSGATNEGNVNAWINAHSPTTIPLFDWGQGYPGVYSTTYSCQCFDLAAGCYLASCICSYTNSSITDNGYICELI